MRRARAGLLALCGLLAMSGIARAAAVVAASQNVRGAIVELRFTIRGRGMRWRLVTARQQLAIVLENTRLRLRPHPLMALVAPVNAVSAAALGSDKTRLAIDVSGKVDYAIAVAGDRLIVRIARAGAAPDIAAPLITHFPYQAASAPHYRPRPTLSALPPEVDRNAARNVETAAIAPVSTLRATPQTAPLVMLDPGHGGYDPGTRSASGIAEKDLALQIAQRVRADLIAAGLRVEMTRDDDHFVSLADRTRRANHAGADLFVSIHLNASPDQAAAGIETYYLNTTTDRATIRLAHMENAGADGIMGARGDPNLGYILTDLRQNYKANEAESLAQMIELDSVAALDRSGMRVNDLGARSGPFYVLVGAEMPSVLVECGFLSNPVEAARLAHPDYQAALAHGIAAAVVNYLGSNVAVGNL